MPDYADLLERGSQAQADQEYLNERARIIEDTLQSFGAPGKVVEINTGPVITQFGVEPDYLVSRQGKKTRVKVGAIARLDSDLALALAARTIRIEAPVPGKGYVGIEVPNSKPSVVSLRDIMDEPAYQKIDSRLRVALGRSVDGQPIVADLTTMPHLLIAGTTGSGKSVCVNAIISTLLLENTPDDLRFIMVDPKRVELTGYNGIPHLVEGMPVVVDLERIVGVLKWVTREMEERYKRFSAATARNIVDFNSKLQPGTPKLPYLVVVIDELADLMMLAPEETEKTLARLAQMARATGIHLIVSTQRPSVDVVTGLIKANFPARISFAVASSVDSRVILDQPGAEKLLGRGDMLYQAPDAAAPMRCQGVYLSDNEIHKITQYWKGQRGRSNGSPSLAPPNRAVMDVPPADPVQSRAERLGLTNGTGSGSKPGTPLPTPANPANRLFEKDPPALNRPGGTGTGAPAGDEDDELYEEAVKIYRENDGKVGIQLLQRRLRVGYMRAARLIDLMKARGLNVDSKAGATEETTEDEEE
jgi:DNA segregation ATPase FtsK/SpoIIIE, S-DNA-T family